MTRLAIVLGAAVLLLAGCGGGDSSEAKPLTKSEYQAQLEQTAAEVAGQVGSTNDIDKMSAAELDKFADVLHGFADKLAEIVPPDEVRDQHADLIQALNDLADEFPDLAAELKNSKDAGEGIAAFFGAKGVQELFQVGEAFKKKGYDLNLNPSS